MECFYCHEFLRIFETQVQKRGVQGEIPLPGRGVSPQKLFLSLLLAASGGEQKR
jgi:hypothetical protein